EESFLDRFYKSTASMDPMEFRDGENDEECEKSIIVMDTPKKTRLQILYLISRILVKIWGVQLLGSIRGLVMLLSFMLEIRLDKEHVVLEKVIECMDNVYAIEGGAEYMRDGVLRETLKDVDGNNYLVIVVDEAHMIFEQKEQVVRIVYIRVIVVDEAHMIFEQKEQVVRIVYIR
nr:hypothetical protein [Tanacetum cinerariifolium]